ncbi:putative small nuclear ribonucleoprotein Sm D2 [Camelus dromedarius]|uniref:Putative small nuclear ribonucleoprotein Sm D2 n=1 Tax=Camelus dromedarius TaxID=9838 RepID=A0A5N4CQ66_CAMDR|nr:putative small nuclear ribonucleoprotein Sm D2 [Camelus dromedarius]
MEGAVDHCLLSPAGSQIRARITAVAREPSLQAEKSETAPEELRGRGGRVQLGSTLRLAQSVKNDTQVLVNYRNKKLLGRVKAFDRHRTWCWRIVPRVRNPSQSAGTTPSSRCSCTGLGHHGPEEPTHHWQVGACSLPSEITPLSCSATEEAEMLPERREGRERGEVHAVISYDLCNAPLRPAALGSYLSPRPCEHHDSTR